MAENVYGIFPDGIVIGTDPLQRTLLRQNGYLLEVDRPITLRGPDVSGTIFRVTSDLTLRARVPLASVNAGFDILTDFPGGSKWRMVDIKTISIGGNLAATAAATGYAIYGVQGGSTVALFSVLLAAAAQSVVDYPGLANTSVLADGASFASLDPGTHISIKATSAGAFDLITTQFIDVILTLALEA